MPSSVKSLINVSLDYFQFSPIICDAVINILIAKFLSELTIHC